MKQKKGSVNSNIGQHHSSNHSSKEENKERMQNNKDTLRDLWDIKQTNIRNIGVPEKRDRKGQKTYLKKKTTENFPNLDKETNAQI